MAYREYAPSPELRPHVRTYFSFAQHCAPFKSNREVVREVQFARDESFCSPVFADGHASLVMELGGTCQMGEGWTSGAPVRARVIGPLRTVGGIAGNTRPEMIGVYFTPGSALLHASAIELTDRIVSLEQIWGSNSRSLAEDIADFPEEARVERLEAALLERLRSMPIARPSIDVAGIARWICTKPASMTVHRLAHAAGVSRQHLTRVFRQAIGVSPKRYCRLARFQAALIYAGAGANVQWAQVAAQSGYADQSHMIAEFRELSSLTPEMLATQQWFHPFILEARSRVRVSTGPSAATTSSLAGTGVDPSLV